MIGRLIAWQILTLAERASSGSAERPEADVDASPGKRPAREASPKKITAKLDRIWTKISNWVSSGSKGWRPSAALQIIH
jgi:hypothetical protein